MTLTPVLIIPFMLFAGFFVNQANIPKFLIVFQYLSIFKYGYQALMENEYQDLGPEQLPCLEASGQDQCDPLGEFASPQTLEQSIWAIVAMYVGCYFISWMIMISLSRKYE